MTTIRPLIVALLTVGLLAAGCSGSDDAGTEDADADPTASTSAPPGDAPQADDGGIRLVTAEMGLALQANPPNDLVILDVRTPEEFAEGHLEGAIMIDFYDDDFADQLAGLDPDVPYLLYCRSGNRSGQTTAIMSELGFTDVADLDGGILAWTAATNPVVGG